MRSFCTNDLTGTNHDYDVNVDLTCLFRQLIECPNAKGFTSFSSTFVIVCSGIIICISTSSRFGITN